MASRGGRRSGFFAYRYEIDDLIERYRVGDNFTFRNRGRATIEGVEVEVQTAFAEVWSLEAGLAVSDGARTAATAMAVARRSTTSRRPTAG